jgi:hypothetical protein
MIALTLDSAHAHETTTSHQAQAAGAVAGLPRLLLRAEGAAMFAAGVYAYAQLGAGWGMFAALFLVPDLSMLGYLAGPRAGAHSYNLAHSYLAPAVLALAGLVAPAWLPWAALWLAHIGFDRALGYGLKYTTAFGDTHLGRVGSRA